LDRIVETKQKELSEAKAREPLEAIRDRAAAAALPCSLYAALTAPPPHAIHLIAEIKKASPSAGLIREDFDPAAIARTVHDAGASAISVLTDREYFQGDLGHIERVKQATPLPVLRKDFTLEAYHVYEARAAGADAVLLIGEILPTRDCVELAALAEGLGMTPLVEAHRPNLLLTLNAALQTAGVQTYLLGINNRNLARQVTDIQATEDVARMMADTSRLVAESGIHTCGDVERVKKAGAAAMLVGESLMASADIAAKIAALLR
jgi:indole-3-glycerol phosphate synthase